VAIVTAYGFLVAGGRSAPPLPAGSVARPAVVAGAGSAMSKTHPVASEAQVPDVPWLIQTGDGRWAYGHGARLAPRWLPDGETGLAVGGRWLASVLPGGHGHSTVRIRDRGNGRIVADVAAPIWVSAGAWAQAGLVVTGYGDASMTTDGGLLLIAPDGGTTSRLVPAGAFPAGLGTPVARGGVLVSPSGTRVASNACGLERCETQVVDLATATVSRPIQGGPGFLRTLTDDAIVTTDGDGAWISARRIVDGAEVWRQRDSILLDPVAGADGSIVGVVGSARTGWGVASIDAAGRVRNLTARSRGQQPWPRIWTDVSTFSMVVLAHEGFAETVASGHSTPVTLVDPRDGAAPAMTAEVRLPAVTEGAR
jgi:hypothetical protein